MNKREFLAVLRRELYILPQNELKEQLSFYSEMIDDGVEEGLTEEQAVSKIGSISEILSQIQAADNKSNSSETVKIDKAESNGLGAGAKTLLIVGSPLWIVLLAVAFVVTVSIYASLWAVWISIFAVEIALIAAAGACLLYPILLVIQGAFLPAAFLVGGGLVCAGLSIFLWYGCKGMLFGFVKLTKWSFLKIVSIFKTRGDWL